MAGELQADYQQSGLVNLIYFEVRSATSTIYNFSSLAFEAYNASNIANYGRFATEQGASGFYTANMPAVALGNYTIRAKLAQVASTPAENDTRIGFQQMFWSGTAVLIPGGTLAGSLSVDSLTVTGGTTFANTSGPGLTISTPSGSALRIIGPVLPGYGIQVTGDTLFNDNVQAPWIGNFTGNIIGTVSTVLGIAGVTFPTNFGNLAIDGSGNLTGTVAGVTGNVGGNVGGSVTGSVGLVVGNVGGNVVGSVASVTAPVTVGTNNDKTGYALTQSFPTRFSSMSIDTNGRVAIQTNETINTALDNFQFLMVKASNGDPMSGLTVQSQRVIDNGAPAPTAGSVTEVAGSLGLYKISLQQSDRNGKVITFIFSAPQAATRYITIVTTP